MKIRWTAPASKDLQQIARYIRRDNPAAARKVARTIFDAADSLQQFPNRGRVGRIAGTREYVFPGWPYILVYRINDTTIEILRIYHAAQDWP